jgi:hypothetical protein
MGIKIAAICLGIVLVALALVALQFSPGSNTVPRVVATAALKPLAGNTVIGTAILSVPDATETIVEIQAQRMDYPATYGILIMTKQCTSTLHTLNDMEADAVGDGSNTSWVHAPYDAAWWIGITDYRDFVVACGPVAFGTPAAPPGVANPAPTPAPGNGGGTPVLVATPTPLPVGAAATPPGS